MRLGISVKKTPWRAALRGVQSQRMSSVCPITSLEQFNSSLRSLNRVLAQYKQLLRQVGTVTDCARVREQLQSLSVRLLASFTVSKDVILPAMQSQQALAGPGNNSADDEESEAAATRKQWEARYTTFVQIIESTLDNLLRTASLVKRFPLHADSLNRFVATGIADFYNVERRSILSLSSSLRSSRRSSMSSGSRISVLGSNGGGGASGSSGTPDADFPSTEADAHHLMSLSAEARATRELIEQLQSAVLIAHWTVQHKFDFEFSSFGGGGASSGSSSGGGGVSIAATAVAAAAAAAAASTSTNPGGADVGRPGRAVEAWADPDGADNAEEVQSGSSKGDRRTSTDAVSHSGRGGGLASLCLICK